MNWKQKDPYHLVSECGKYSIAKIKASGWIHYEAFRLGKPSEFLGSAAVKEDSSSGARAEVLEQVKALCL